MDQGIVDAELVRLAIIGGGPMGLETALYARYLGYRAMVLERQTSFDEMDLRTSSSGFATSWSECMTPLGLAAIDAHQAAESTRAAHQTLTWSAYIAEYLRPLSETDLVCDTLRFGQRVVHVRPASDAELVAAGGDGTHGDVVPAEEFDGPSNELPWGGLAEEDREWTERPWCVRSVDPGGRTGEAWFDCVIDVSGLDCDSGGVAPDWSWYDDLPLTLDAQFMALPLLAAGGLTAEHAVRWSDISQRMPLGGGGALSLGHAGLFVLGRKSYGRTSHFQFADGYAQIRDLFAWLGGRRQLDLYRTARP